MIFLLLITALATDPWGPHLGVTQGELRPAVAYPEPPEGTFLDADHEPARIPPDCSAYLRFRDDEADPTPVSGFTRLNPTQAARFDLPTGPFGPDGAESAIVWATWTTKAARVPDEGWPELHACCVTQPDLCSSAITAAWYLGSGELRPVLHRRATALLRDLDAGRAVGPDHRALGEPIQWRDAWFAMRVDAVSPPTCADFAQAEPPPGVVRRSAASDAHPTPGAARAEARARALSALQQGVFSGLDPADAHRDALASALGGDHVCVVSADPEPAVEPKASAPSRAPTAGAAAASPSFTAHARVEVSHETRDRLRELVEAR